MNIARVSRLLKRYLVTGVLVLAPISISLSLLLWLGGWVDRLLLPLAFAVFGRDIPGLGLASATVLTLCVGWLGSNIIGKQVVEVLEDLLLHVPVFSWVYRTVKQLAEVFSPGGASAFRSVVMVEYPREGVYQLGFATGTVTPMPDGEPLTSVYIPTNHLYIGDVILVPPGKVKET
ncbi:MAG: hypothetical protein FD126_1405, partial [Elusimicrobia bacterium]